MKLSTRKIFAVICTTLMLFTGMVQTAHASDIGEIPNYGVSETPPTRIFQHIHHRREIAQQPNLQDHCLCKDLNDVQNKRMQYQRQNLSRLH